MNSEIALQIIGDILARTILTMTETKTEDERLKLQGNAFNSICIIWREWSKE